MCSTIGEKCRGMTMLSPAANWRDALPCGNGKIGALVYGDVTNERLVVNIEDLYCGGKSGKVPDISLHLSELRSLLLRGDYDSANGLYPDIMRRMGFDSKLPDYHPAFDLMINSIPKDSYKYKRSLNFETGEALVNWSQGVTKFIRKSFVSLADDIVVVSISSEGGELLDIELSLREHDFTDAVKPNGDSFFPDFDFFYDAMGDELFLYGQNHDGRRFGGLAKVVTTGQIETTRDSIRVYDTNDVLVVIGVFSGELPEIASETIKTKLKSIELDYEGLLSRHVMLHGEIFSRVKLNIGDPYDMNTPNETLLQETSEALPTELLVRMFDYGRYLLLCSSNKGCLPSNLQGIWNGDYRPPWNSCFINNENIQMTYWQALPCNMPETALAFFDYYESLIDDFRENAKKLWGCRGIFVPLNTAPDSGLIRDIQSHVVYWTGAAGWISQLFYDYWLFTGDKDFLTHRAVPFMKEAALFYEDFIMEDREGFNMFCPSNSPENAPNIDQVEEDENGNTVMNPGIPVTINSTVDFAIAKELLTNLCCACEFIGIEKDSVARWKRMLAKMPDYQINDDGALKEWMYPGLNDNYHHRHMSHLYPLFPGQEITQEKFPALFNACVIAVEKRFTIGLKEQTGWSLAHMANVYARIGKPDQALECLELLSKSCVGKNLLTYHNDWRNNGITLNFIYGKNAPLQLDANMGWTAAVIEMLLYSTPEIIKILPALPKVWKSGGVEGLSCRNGVNVNVQWDQSAAFLKVNLHAKRESRFLVKFPGFVYAMQCSNPEFVNITDLGSCYRRLSMPANGQIEIVLNVNFSDHAAKRNSKKKRSLFGGISVSEIDAVCPIVRNQTSVL